MRIDVGRVLRLRRKNPRHGWRLWYVTAHRMGALNQEDVWELLPLDREPGDPELCQVPAQLLESHPDVEVICGEWFRANCWRTPTAQGHTEVRGEVEDA